MDPAPDYDAALSAVHLGYCVPIGSDDDLYVKDYDKTGIDVYKNHRFVENNTRFFTDLDPENLLKAP